MTRSSHGLYAARLTPQAVITGTAADDTLAGTSGADTIDGGLGADLMQGGLGGDVYIVDNIGDTVVEAAGGGVDSVQSSISYTLGDNVERLSLVGSANISGTGNALANVLLGNAGDNELSGGDGNDALTGDRGNDTLHGGNGDDTLTAVGSLFDGDELNGDAGNDRLNLIDGGYADGGEGNDWIKASSDVFFANSNVYGGAGNDTLLGVGKDGAGFHLHGDDGDDLLNFNSYGSYEGGAGNDTLAGMTDADTWSPLLNGGTGNDLLQAGDASTEYQDDDADADTIIGGLGEDSYNGAWGDAGSNIVWVHDGAGTQAIHGNTVSGIEFVGLTLGAGDDRVDLRLAPAGLRADIAGGAGNDTLISVSTSNDAHKEQASHLDGGDGNDELRVVRGAAQMSGGAGKDKLVGGKGADLLAGDGGSDKLTGGKGADGFQFNSLSGSDTVADFTSAVDHFQVLQTHVSVGDADNKVDGGVVVQGPGGFSENAELVIATADIAGAITAASAAAAIGSASGAYADHRTAIFAVDNGVDTAVYYFQSAGTDAVVSASELTLLATLSGTASTALGDYEFGS